LARLEGRDEADFVVATAGVYDVLAEVQCADEAHLDELLTDLRPVPGVAGIETMGYLRFHKRTYAWPPGAGGERQTSGRCGGGVEPTAGSEVPSARATARALSRLSSYSASGSESATMPPPTCR